MESGSMELKVMSCKDVRSFNFFQKLSVYALVSLVSHDPNKKLEQNQQQRTPTDKDGDPDWNHEMRFDLNEVSLEDCDHVFIHFDLRHEGVMFGDKNIGEVHVAFKDLMEESNGVVRFASYQVRTSEGKPNGVLSFSYKVSGKGMNIGTATTPASPTGFPIIHDIDQQQYSNENEIIHYPSLESHNLSEEPLSAPQQVHSLSNGMHYPSHHQAYYPPPDAYYYAPPPPPPPPPMQHGPPFHPPHLHRVYPDPYKFGGGYDYYGPHGPPGSPGSRGFDDNRETWSNGFRARRDQHGSFWNGR
ncbi:protein SRC2 homolog isoform X2 [Fagus crenata]|jgi:hypothetical protein